MDINIESEILRVIDIEIKGLSLLKKKVNMSVKNAVEAIFNCRGKVILTGMGKSGLVAKKIASTMSSVGTPAMFMRPAEGMHGIWVLLPLKRWPSLLEKAGKVLNLMASFLQ